MTATLEELQRRALESNPEFEAWAHSLPQAHWARRDISSARLGWEAAKAVRARNAPECDHNALYMVNADGFCLLCGDAVIVTDTSTASQGATADEAAVSPLK